MLGWHRRLHRRKVDSNMSFGKLILTPTVGPRQEFSLAKATVTLGRATNSDVILEDRNVSRSHTVLKCDELGCELVDLGSANGTRVNGVRVDRASLKPGDIITIGKNTLHFEADNPAADVETCIETPQDLETNLAETPLQVHLEETGEPRLTVHLPGRTWDVSLARDTITIGRRPESDIVIESAYVSRQHARIERRGDSFLIRDLGGNVGTWLGDRRLTEYTFRPGDTIRFVRLTFEEALTIERYQDESIHALEPMPIPAAPAVLTAKKAASDHAILHRIHGACAYCGLVRLRETVSDLTTRLKVMKKISPKEFSAVDKELALVIKELKKNGVVMANKKKKTQAP